MIVLTLGLMLGALVASAPQKALYLEKDFQMHFEEFKTKFNKTYSHEEDIQRFEIFQKNLRLINELNFKHEEVTYGITAFTDQSHKEFQATHACLDINVGDSCSPSTVKFNTTGAPESFSWVDEGKVTPVKDQGGCGSCWAFSTTGNVEGQYAIKYGQLTSFSEQQLVDCSTENNGCNGGSYEYALRYLQSGLMSSDQYPYRGSQGPCQYNPSKTVTTVANCISYQTRDLEELKNIIYTIGPLSLDVYSNPWQHYTGGILTEETCPPISINHAVLLVGYGSDNGVPYWLVKNSWGTNHALGGYVKLIRQLGQNPCNMYNINMAVAILANFEI